MTPRVPYHFGSPATEPYFCDREDEVGTLERRMHDGIHVFVLGPRRYGKSSIVERALQRFRAGGGRAGYTDLILCTTEAEVAQQLLSAVVNGVLSGPRRKKEQLELILRRLRVAPAVSFKPDGGVTFAFDPLLASRSWQRIFDDALAVLDDAAGEGPVALAVDEFQRVAEIGREGMGGAFKAAADRITNASLVLAGSHLSVMEKLTKARGAPLYGMGELLVIDAVPEDAMGSYLQRRARAAGKRLTKATAGYLYRRAGAVPNDVQWLAYAAFEAASGRDSIDERCVDAGIASIVARQAPSFAERFETLAPSQQRVLKLLAARPAAKVYAREFLAGVQVANANAVRKALDVLMAAELVQRRAGVYEVASPFLRVWLRPCSVALAM